MKLILIFLSIILLASSCGNYKRFTYLQSAVPVKPDSIYQASIVLYHLQPADVLQVRISSLDENINKLFNLDASLSSPTLSSGSVAGSMFLTGYSIDKDGNISLPVLGKVQVGGLTLDDARKKVQQSAEAYIKEARADVKLVSFKISILGEISRPGQYSIFNEKANVFEAVSMGGDITYNGNRKKVVIIRNLATGTQTIEVDLTQRNILSSSQYYLQPNDIIYVQPFKSTAFRVRMSDYSVFLTLITSTITAVLLVTNAIK